MIPDNDAESAVERELVLRLANVLWRLHRASSIETGRFESVIEALTKTNGTCFHARTSLMSY